MALSTYTDLEAALTLWSAREDLAAVMGDIIRLAETRLDADLEVQELQVTTTLTVPTDGNSVLLPDNFNGVISVKCGTTTLDYYSQVEVDAIQASGETGNPRGYSIGGNSLVIAPVSGEQVVTLTYWKRIDPLTPVNSTNDIIVNYPNLYHRCCLMYVYEFAHDPENSAIYEQRYLNALNTINLNNWNNVSSLQIRVS